MNTTTLPPLLSRRLFFDRLGMGLGGIALATLLNRESGCHAASPASGATLLHFAPLAKRVVFLFQSGGPSQVDLFDHKPKLAALHGDELPDSVRMGQRLTTMTSSQSTKPIAPSLYRFARHGQSGMEFSSLLPHTAAIADELCLVRSLHTDAINHDPAITLLMTGSQQPGRPSFGSWVTYGLGSGNENLPAFTVFISGGEQGDQPLNGRLWGPGFLPAQHQGVKFRGEGDPVLYLSNPPGLSAAARRRELDALAQLNARQELLFRDPQIAARIAQFELAFRMQSAVPELTNVADEPASTFALYGEDARRPGTYAANCLLARRMLERGVRFVQLMHRGWDHHANLPSRLPKKCQQVDQSSAALVKDLKQRGLLQDTLVIWAGEFGRTVFSQGDLAKDDFGRDHHPRCFSAWFAGGGMRSGVTIGRTDDFSYNVADDPIHIHDLQATILRCLGIDHERFTFRHQGRDYRLTDIAGTVVQKMLR